MQICTVNNNFFLSHSCTFIDITSLELKHFLVLWWDMCDIVCTQRLLRNIAKATTEQGRSRLFSYCQACHCTAFGEANHQRWEGEKSIHFLVISPVISSWRGSKHWTCGRSHQQLVPFFLCKMTSGHYQTLQMPKNSETSETE